MNNHTGNFALFTNPKLAQEALEELKTMTPPKDREATLEMLSNLSERDLYFYSLGKTVGVRKAVASFQATFLGIEQEAERQAEHE
jgi:hypothetical protein